jgi:hypothetical protein
MMNKNRPTKELETLAQSMHLKQIIANDYQVQPTKSYLCGYYALYLAKVLRKYVGKLNEKLFYNIISDTFGNHPSFNNVSKVVAYGNKIGIL